MNRMFEPIYRLKLHFKPSVSSRQSRLVETRLRGIFLAAARVLWISAAVLTVIFVVVSIPVTFAQLQMVCESGACLLTPASLRQLAELGLSVGFFAAYLIVVELLFVVVSFSVGAVIFCRMWGKSNEYFALFVALTLVTFGTMAFLGPNETFAGSASLWRWLFVFVVFFGNTFSILFFYLFPDGRFVPRWMGVLAVVLVVLQVRSFFFPDLPLLRWLYLPGQTENIFFLASIVFAQIYRDCHSTLSAVGDQHSHQSHTRVWYPHCQRRRHLCAGRGHAWRTVPGWRQSAHLSCRDWHGGRALSAPASSPPAGGQPPDVW
jgi:hypothetical protein